MSVDGIKNKAQLLSASFSHSSGLSQFSPEPRNRLGNAFKNILGNVGSFIGGGASSFGGIDPGYVELINKQIEVQKQMQLVSMHSNIEKSKHDTSMAAIRNVRAA